MAFGWFKKNKNNRHPVPAEEQVSEVQEDEEPAPEAEPQKMATGEDNGIGGSIAECPSGRPMRFLR